jgi:hypothetical protein
MITFTHDDRKKYEVFGTYENYIGTAYTDTMAEAEECVARLKAVNKRCRPSIKQVVRQESEPDPLVALMGPYNRNTYLDEV